MTALEYRQYTLSCDSPEHHRNPTAAFFRSLHFPNASRAELRKLAAKNGWTHVRSVRGRKYNEDFCPEHKP